MCYLSIEKERINNYVEIFVKVRGKRVCEKYIVLVCKDERKVV